MTAISPPDHFPGSPGKFVSLSSKSRAFTIALTGAACVTLQRIPAMHFDNCLSHKKWINDNALNWDYNKEKQAFASFASNTFINPLKNVGDILQTKT